MLVLLVALLTTYSPLASTRADAAPSAVGLGRLDGEGRVQGEAVQPRRAARLTAGSHGARSALERPEWAILFYLGHGGNLDAEAQAVFEALAAADRRPGVDVYVLWDRSDPDTRDALYRIGGQTDPSRYTLGSDMWLPAELGLPDELDMGGEDTLVKFVNWVLTENPSHVMLVLWNHGLGFAPTAETGMGATIEGICWDDDDSYLTSKELRAAFRRFGKPIDVLHLNACLMQMLEVLWQIGDGTDQEHGARYVVSAEDLTWSVSTRPSWEARLLSAVGSSTTPSGLARLVAATYHESLVAEGQYHTVSVVDLGQLPGVMASFASFADALRAALPEHRPAIESSRAATQKFDENADLTISEDDAYIDLWHFAHGVSQAVLGVDPAAVHLRQSARRLMRGVRGMVKYNEYLSDGPRRSFSTGAHGEASTNGISIYFPRSSEHSHYGNYQNTSATPADLELVAETHWDEFLNDLFAQGSP